MERDSKIVLFATLILLVSMGVSFILNDDLSVTSVTGKAVQYQTQPVYAFRCQYFNEYFYTLDKSEGTNNGCEDKGVAFYTLKEQAPGSLPLYRFICNLNNDHTYKFEQLLSNCGERNSYNGYFEEGNIGYVFSTQGVQVVGSSKLFLCSNPENPNDNILTLNSQSSCSGFGYAFLSSTPYSSCEPNWKCSDWSTCSSLNSQTRTCTDQNSCGVTTGKPSESQSCTYSAPTTTTPNTTTTTTTPTCTDSDGGKDYYKQGTTKSENVPSFTNLNSKDYCFSYFDYNSGKNVDMLVEYFCNEQQKIIQGASTDYRCPYGCKDGACMLGFNDPDNNQIPVILGLPTQNTPTNVEQPINTQNTEQTVKCGVARFTVQEECSEGFTQAFVRCQDGEQTMLGEETSCKSSETWQQYAEDFCKNRCNNVVQNRCESREYLPIETESGETPLGECLEETIEEENIRQCDNDVFKRMPEYAGCDDNYIAPLVLDCIKKEAPQFTQEINACLERYTSSGETPVPPAPPVQQEPFVKLYTLELIDGNLVIEYSKNFVENAHLKSKQYEITDPQQNQISDSYLELANEQGIHIRKEADYNNDLTIGEVYYLCHGNNPNICSDAVELEVSERETYNRRIKELERELQEREGQLEETRQEYSRFIKLVCKLPGVRFVVNCPADYDLTEYNTIQFSSEAGKEHTFILNDNVVHTLKVLEVLENRQVKVEIQSEPIILTLNIDEPNFVDLDNDEIADLEITLNEVEDDDILLTLRNTWTNGEETTQQTTTTTQEENDDVTQQTSDENVGQLETSTENLPDLIVENAFISGYLVPEVEKRIRLNNDYLLRLEVISKNYGNSQIINRLRSPEDQAYGERSSTDATPFPNFDNSKGVIGDIFRNGEKIAEFVNYFSLYDNQDSNFSTAVFISDNNYVGLIYLPYQYGGKKVSFQETGEYCLKNIRIDPDNKVIESNEDNNVLESGDCITITEATDKPNLVVIGAQFISGGPISTYSSLYPHLTLNSNQGYVDRFGNRFSIRPLLKSQNVGEEKEIAAFNGIKAVITKNGVEIGDGFYLQIEFRDDYSVNRTYPNSDSFDTDAYLDLDEDGLTSTPERINPLEPGVYCIENIMVDPENLVEESNEDDNVLEKGECITVT